MHLVFNERTKSTVSWFNAIATALIAAGVFAPAAALLYGLAALPIGVGTVMLLVFVCFAIAACLHFIGWFLLGRLRE